MAIYTNTFGGTPVQPSNVSYEALTLNEAITQLNWPLIYQESPLPVAQFIDVTSNDGSYTIQMPDATLVSTGTATIFSNIGEENYTINDYNGNNIIADIEPTQVYYVILTDNTTQNGVWETLLFGATTASANAAALAGLGLVALMSKLNTNTPVNSISTPYTVNPTTDRAGLFVWTGGTAAFTLPVSSVATNGFFVCVNNESMVGGVLGVTPPMGETVDNLTVFTLNPGESASFIADGNNWFSLGYGNNANISIGVNNITVTGGTVILTDSQSSRQIQNISGTLGSNAIIEGNTTPQQYYVTNNTTGGFTLSFQMNGGSNVNIIPQGTTMQLYCDGTDMWITPTNTTGVSQFNSGTVSAPSISFAANEQTGFYYIVSNQLGVSVNNQEVVIFQPNYVDAAQTSLIRQGQLNIYSLNQCYD